MSKNFINSTLVEVINCRMNKFNNNIKIILFICIISNASLNLFAQNEKSNYTPIVKFQPQDSLIKSLILKLKEPSYKSGLTDKDILKKINELSLERTKFFQELYDDKSLMYGDEVTDFVNDVLSYLITSNNNLKSTKYIAFTVRDNDVNAFSLSEGILAVNIGLLSRLNSWEELAFVMGHEIGHDYLNHAKEHVELVVGIEKDKKTQKDLKTASRKTNDRYSEIEKIYLNTLSKAMLSSRKNEISSDSVGYHFINNAKIDLSKAVSMLNILDSADYFVFKDSVDIINKLSTPNYSIDPKWLINEDATSSWSRAKELYLIPDSLKSHPDCANRIEILNKYNFQKKFNTNKDFEDKFESLKKSFAFELLITLMENNEYSTVLYNALNMQEIYPDDVFLNYIIAHALLEIASTMINQEFIKYTPFPNKEYPYGFNALLQFLHNLNSKKMLYIYQNYSTVHLSENKIPEYNNFLKTIYDYKINNVIDKEALNKVYTYNYFIDSINKIKKTNKIK